MYKRQVLAVPKDMEIAGYGTEHGNLLRLWDANSPTPVDMNLFSSGQYLKAVEQRAMAESISKVLYPEDNHYEGKSLRLKQQYFFVSATIQSIAVSYTHLAASPAEPASASRLAPARDSVEVYLSASAARITTT